MGKYIFATGRRKKSIARVRLAQGSGNFTVNGKKLEEYFKSDLLIQESRRPFEITGTEGTYDVIATVTGG
jgi:small subunit ribosomal protein S9